MCVGWYPPKPLSLANLVNLGTRFLLRGVVLSHPEIFEFQDVIKIKNNNFLKILKFSQHLFFFTGNLVKINDNWLFL